MSSKYALIKSRLNQIFQQVFDNEEIQVTDNTSADNIEAWDSLIHISLIVAIEKEFDIELNTAEVAKLSNVGEMIQLIEKRIS
ncbi:MAG: acyl carrier protein [Pseudomonadota bacterium]